MVSHLIRCIAITYWIFKSLQQFKMPIQKKVWKLIGCNTYIYIYIYSRSQTDCFVVSQLFRHVGRLKLGLKPVQLYVRLSIIPLSQHVNHVSFEIIRHYVVAFVCLPFLSYRIPECSIHSKSFALFEWQL